MANKSNVIPAHPVQRPERIKVSMFKSKKDVIEKYNEAVKYIESLEKQHQHGRERVNTEHQRELKELGFKMGMLEKTISGKQHEIDILAPQNRQLTERNQEYAEELEQTNRAYLELQNAFEKVRDEKNNYAKYGHKNLASDPWVKLAIGSSVIAAGLAAYFIIDKFL